MTEAEIYSALGEKGFAKLVHAFYSRVRVDDLLGKMYPQNEFDAAEDRLREFLIQRFGGPSRYSEMRGHPRLRMRHAPFKVDLAARDRWLELMMAAIKEAQLPGEIETILWSYFVSTANFMINHP